MELIKVDPEVAEQMINMTIAHTEFVANNDGNISFQEAIDNLIEHLYSTKIDHTLLIKTLIHMSLLGITEFQKASIDLSKGQGVIQ